jgi:hypothetical protein
VKLLQDLVLLRLLLCLFVEGDDIDKEMWVLSPVLLGNAALVD